MTDVTSWSETDASNNSAAPAGAPEGMAFSGVNDTIRALMGGTARLYNRDHPVKTTGGSANVQTLALDTAPASYIAGQRFAFKAGFTNTAAVTLNVNTLGAKNIFVNTPAGPAACKGGEIIANGIYVVDYDGTQLVLLNPTPQVGSWTPVLTFATAGNLSVVYSAQVGTYERIGNYVRLQFDIITSTFTHTTASGALNVTGLPFTPVTLTNYQAVGSMDWQGITKANYTQVTPLLSSADATMVFTASGSGQSISAVAAADMPTGGAVFLRGTIVYRI